MRRGDLGSMLLGFVAAAAVAVPPGAAAAAAATVAVVGDRLLCRTPTSMALVCVYCISVSSTPLFHRAR